jgi:hypothetical protein
MQVTGQVVSMSDKELCLHHCPLRPSVGEVKAP